MSSLDETYDTYTGCNATFMAAAYLGYITSYKTVWIDIPQDYYDLGFWGSFEKHVGMNKQEFYDSYNQFLRTGDPDDEPPEGWAPPENYISEHADFLKIVPVSMEMHTQTLKAGLNEDLVVSHEKTDRFINVVLASDYDSTLSYPLILSFHGAINTDRTHEFEPQDAFSNLGGLSNVQPLVDEFQFILSLIHI